VILTIEILFIILLAVVLFLIVKTDGLFAKCRSRHAKAEGCWAGKDRRRYPRFAEALGVSYVILEKNTSKKSSTHTINISAGGIKLILDEKLSVGTFLNLKIAIPASRQMTEMEGEVVWTEDAQDVQEPSGKRFFYSGIRFSSIKDPSGKYLIDYIRSISSSQEG